MPKKMRFPWEPMDQNLLAATLIAPRVPWGLFLNKFDWKPGEHITLIGPTGSGKTTLLDILIRLRTYAVVFATKPRDATMDALIVNGGFQKYEAWPRNLKPDRSPRRVIWPDASQIDSATTQQGVFANAFAEVYHEGGWNLFLDETWYMDRILGLGQQVRIYLLQARSLDISLVMAAQRPVSIPVEAFDQSTWLFFFRDSDERNLERIGGISWRDAQTVRLIVSNLEQYQVLAINTRTGEMWRTRVPPPKPFVPPEKHWWSK